MSIDRTLASVVSDEQKHLYPHATTQALGRFDPIIASDVLYERDQPETLSQFNHQHSADPVNTIVLDPDRGNRNGFCRKMHALGYTLDLRRAGSTQSKAEACKGHYLNFSRS